jgi:hypothetical protein
VSDPTLSLGWSSLAAGDTLVAASIGLERLAERPDDQEALSLTLEAMTRESRPLVLTDLSVDALLARVSDPVVRARLEGAVATRRGLAMLDERVPGFVVRGWFVRALAACERAGDDPAAMARAAMLRRLLEHNASLRERAD